MAHVKDNGSGKASTGASITVEGERCEATGVTFDSYTEKDMGNPKTAALILEDAQAEQVKRVQAQIRNMIKAKVSGKATPKGPVGKRIDI